MKRIRRGVSGGVGVLHPAAAAAAAGEGKKDDKGPHMVLF